MAQYSVFPVKPQLFPLTYSMISHIRFRCSAKIHSKLIQTCKFFFAKNPVVPVYEARFYEEDYIQLYVEPCWINKNPLVEIDLKNKPYKLWVTTALNFTYTYIDISDLISKIYRFDQVHLIFEDQKMNYSTLKLSLNIDCNKLLDNLRNRNVLLTCNSASYYNMDNFDNSLRLSIARVNSENLKIALDIIYEEIQKLAKQ